jgi:hypothetical protein
MPESSSARGNKALEEATALGLTNETPKQFFFAQIQQRKH